jgi:iron complex transport system substrate-binding protein
LRIASLLPSATEIVAALGLADRLVAVTHECDYPASAVEGRAVVTSSPVGQPYEVTDDDGDTYLVEPTSREIDEQVRAALDAGESLYRIDIEKLRELKPDLILTQGLCDVCAVNHKAVAEAVESLGSGVTVLDLAPTTLAQVVESFRQVGDATGHRDAAERLIAETLARWETVRAKVAAAPERPRTLLLEWADPPFSAGHWNPELLRLVNAEPAPWDEIGKPSRTLTWEEITAFAPEVIVFAPCGFDANRAVDEAEVLPDVPGWFDLPAVRNAECYALDGNAYVNRPGPRLADTAEILATVLHPETTQETVPPYSVRLFPTRLVERPKPSRAEREAARQQLNPCP